MSHTYIARFRIRPGTESRFAGLIDEMIEASRADPGTLDYKAFTGTDPLHQIFYESYVDEDADLAHRTGPVTGPIVARMVECIDEGGFTCEVLNEVAMIPMRPVGVSNRG
jgi:quinol monooxygenase YgiN